MSAPLAKISAPCVRSVVGRERLFRRLDAWSHVPAVWVSGPPGAGKTTLLASYVSERRVPCVWYRIDAGDADLASFFYYLARAAAGWRRGCGLPLLTPEYRGGEATFAREFFRRLASPAGPRILVFDDVTEGNSSVCFALRHGLEELAPGTRTVLISREEPPAAFARLAASGAMARLTGEDLRLRRDEALAVARLHAPRGTSAADLARACAAADGWAAAVVLLASGGGPRAGVGLPRRALFDYVASEIFDRQPSEVRRVLVDAAVVAPLPARLANRICGTDRAGAILTELARKAYFTSHRGGVDPTFDLHPLLREFLLARAVTERSEDELRALRSRTGALLAAEGYGDHALALLLEAGEWTAAARVAVAQAPSLVAAGRGATLQRWLGSLPAAERERDPWVAYWLAMCFVAFDAGRARALLDRAYPGFERTADARGLYASCAAALEATILEWSDFHAMDPWLARLDGLAARGLPVPSAELELRLTLATFSATAFRRLDGPDVVEGERRVLEVIRDDAVPPPLRLAMASWYVVESMMRGEVLRCRAVVDACAPLARASRVEPAPSIGWFAAEAVFHWHSGAAGAASDAVEAGLSLARRSGVHAWDYLLQLQGVNAALAADDVAIARSHLAAAMRSLDTRRPLHLAVLAHERGLVALRADDLEGAARDGQAAATHGQRGGAPFFSFLGPVMVALAATRRGDAAAAHPALRAAREAATRVRTSLGEFLCELCDAELARGAADLASAREHLARAFAVARRKGVVPDAWFSREQLADLCAVALSGEVEPRDARALVRRLSLAPPSLALELDAWPWPVRVLFLGSLEVEIDDRPLANVAAAHRRPLAVLGVLVASGGGPVREHVVEDALWPESADAHHALETSLYRLRRLLGDGAVVCGDAALSIDPRHCWVDALALERALARAQASARAGDAAEALRAMKRALGLYRGPFLADHDEPWVLAARERLRRRWRRAFGEVSSAIADPAAVRAIAARAADADPGLGLEATFPPPRAGDTRPMDDPYRA